MSGQGRGQSGGRRAGGGQALKAASDRSRMSVAAAQPALPPEIAFPEPMADGVGRRGLVLSAALHLLLGVMLIFGLPTLVSSADP